MGGNVKGIPECRETRKEKSREKRERKNHRKGGKILYL